MKAAERERRNCDELRLFDEIPTTESSALGIAGSRAWTFLDEKSVVEIGVLGENTSVDIAATVGERKVRILSSCQRPRWRLRDTYG